MTKNNLKLETFKYLKLHLNSRAKLGIKDAQKLYDNVVTKLKMGRLAGFFKELLLKSNDKELIHASKNIRYGFC